MIEVKRRGETFTEFLVAALVFGIMMGGLFEFMANQSETLANIRDRDELMYGAQVILNWTLNGVEDTSGNKVYNHRLLPHLNHSVTAGLDGTYHYYTDGSPTIRIEAINSPITEIEHKIISFDWDHRKKILTVMNDSSSLSFDLQDLKL